MTTFDERRDQFEKKYVHEEELLFKARARRNKLFGLEIAARMGRTGEDAADYAKKLVVAAALDAKGDDGLTTRVSADLEAAGKPIPDGELYGLLAGFMEQAIEEIRGD